jgi:hypothetical protein
MLTTRLMAAHITIVASKEIRCVSEEAGGAQKCIVHFVQLLKLGCSAWCGELGELLFAALREDEDVAPATETGDGDGSGWAVIKVAPNASTAAIPAAELPAAASVATEGAAPRCKSFATS